MTRPKDLGTANETRFVNEAKRAGLQARRIAEGGSYDEGDVEVIDAQGDRWIIECKARAAMSLHPALRKAADKAAAVGAPFVALQWKRLIREPGKKRRVAAGPSLVALTEADFLALLASR